MLIDPRRFEKASANRTRHVFFGRTPFPGSIVPLEVVEIPFVGFQIKIKISELVLEPLVWSNLVPLRLNMADGVEHRQFPREHEVCDGDGARPRDPRMAMDHDAVRVFAAVLAAHRLDETDGLHEEWEDALGRFVVDRDSAINDALRGEPVLDGLGAIHNVRDIESPQRLEAQRMADVPEIELFGDDLRRNVVVTAALFIVRTQSDRRRAALRDGGHDGFEAVAVADALSLSEPEEAVDHMMDHRLYEICTRFG